MIEDLLESGTHDVCLECRQVYARRRGKPIVENCHTCSGKIFPFEGFRVKRKRKPSGPGNAPGQMMLPGLEPAHDVIPL